MSNRLIFGGGCFWCTEAVFKEVEGVMNILPGYAGGEKEDPSYEEVCGGNTGHAEVIYLEFDASKVSYEKLLEIFFQTHNPTTLNKQGNDIGTQYRSIILYYDDEQKSKAENYIDELNRTTYDNKIVTELKPVDVFYAAEEYHHNYFERNPDQAYCQMVIKPKIDKFRKSSNALQL